MNEALWLCCSGDIAFKFASDLLCPRVLHSQRMSPPSPSSKSDQRGDTVSTVMEAQVTASSLKQSFQTSKSLDYPEWFCTGNYSFSKKGSRKLPLELDEKHLREDFRRGSGKGGQAINKNRSRCDLLHIPTGLLVRCQETRSLNQNRIVARRRLSRMLEEQLRGEDSVRAKAAEKERRKKRNKIRKQKKRKEIE